MPLINQSILRRPTRHEVYKALIVILLILIFLLIILSFIIKSKKDNFDLPKCQGSNNKSVESNEFSYIARLIFSNTTHKAIGCGGSLISGEFSLDDS